MDHRFRSAIILLGLCLGLLLSVPQIQAATPIAKVSSFKGEVILLSDTQFTKVTRAGLGLNVGDSIQTKEGEAEITFDDGAVLKVRRHTTTMIQEQEEKSGWWIFKTKDWVRRVTCQVGTFWFKSGSSKTRNYLQTPTAVCGLRGTITEFGYNNVMSYVNAIEGSVEAKGQIQQVTSAFFQNLQAQAQQFAAANQVYTQLSNAYNKDQKAKQTGAALDQADAQVATLAATAAAITEILKNPELGDEAKQILQQALQNVSNDLIKAQENLDKVKEETPTTTAPAETTTAAEPTTTAAEPTTTAAPTTTSVAELTTTVPPTTVSISIPTTTTTTTSSTTLPESSVTTTSSTTTTSTTTVPTTTTTTTTTTSVPTTTTTTSSTTTTTTSEVSPPTTS